MRKQFFSLFLIMAVMAIAQTPSKQTQASNWQKMKDCSAQTDRIAARYGWSEGKITGESVMLSWRNHYSPKYDKCFIQTFYMISGNNKDAERPLHTTELYDAFEFALLAMDAPDFGLGKTSVFCTIGDKMEPCGKCRQFIEDRMKN